MRPSVQRLRSAAVACTASAVIGCALAPMADAGAGTPGSVTVQVTTSSPAAGAALSLAVSGASPSGDRLYTYVIAGADQCAATPAAQSVATDTVATLSSPSGDATSTGAFTADYSATIEVPGSYLVCAYLDDAAADAANVTLGTTALQVGPPAASVVVSAPAKAKEGVAASLSVTGSSAVPGHVYVDVATDNNQCQSTAAAESAASFGVTQLTSASGTPVAAGSFTLPFSFTPPSSGTFTVCAYLAYYPQGTPWAQASSNLSYAGIGTLPPALPGSNCTGSTADHTPLLVIDDCRGREGIGPLTLPGNWRRLTTAQQIFVLADVERVNRGAPPILGLTSQLDQLAQVGAKHKEDPPGAAGDWAGGYSSVMAAEVGWVYDDGYDSPNINCHTRHASGCWGHRLSFLSNAIDLSAGAAHDAHTQSYTLALGGFSSESAYIFSWAQELSWFRHAPTLEPLAKPKITDATVSRDRGGDASVTLTGSSLLNTTAVTFAGQRALRFRCGSEGRCHVTVPARADGRVAVTVRNPAGTSPAVTVRLPTRHR